MKEYSQEFFDTAFKECTRDEEPKCGACHNFKAPKSAQLLARL